MTAGLLLFAAIAVLVGGGGRPMDVSPGLPDLTPDGYLTRLESVQAADAPPARIAIPAIGVDTVIVDVPRTSNSWDTSHLTWQAGHMAGTAFPGQGNNVVVVAHRYLGYDPATLQPASPGAFAALDRLLPGNTVALYAEGMIYTYEVTEQTVVSRADLWPIGATDTETLTLMTCGGTWNTEQLVYEGILVVRARLINVTAEAYASAEADVPAAAPPDSEPEAAPETAQPETVEPEGVIDLLAGGLVKAVRGCAGL